MKVAFYTLGCKVNQYETEAMKERFVSRGYTLSREDDRADIYVINTCTVTNLADRKSRQFIRRAKSLNENALIAVTGCYVQVDPEAVAKIEGVDVIAGTNEKQDIVDFVEKALESKSPVQNVLDYDELDEYRSDGIITAMDSRTRAYVKIEEGCNRFCSYCIIPYARGKVRSRDESEIKEEVRGLIDSGFKEIVLTGINTALYGSDKKDVGLKTLLLGLDDIDGDFRVRLSSLEPTVVGTKDVESILDARRLCNHLHLSIQSGSDNVLKSMNRRYTGSEYLDIVNMLRSRDKFFGITTDIIVGFPGETEEDFADSVDLVKKANFSKVHVFRYSPRKGTVAADMDNQIPGEEKNRRAKILAEISDETSKAFLKSMAGSEARVLFEETKGDCLVGYTDNYSRVYLDCKRLDAGVGEGGSLTLDSLINQFGDVRIKDTYKDGVKGELLNG